MVDMVNQIDDKGHNYRDEGIKYFTGGHFDESDDKKLKKIQKISRKDERLTDTRPLSTEN